MQRDTPSWWDSAWDHELERTETSREQPTSCSSRLARAWWNVGLPCLRFYNTPHLTPQAAHCCDGLLVYHVARFHGNICLLPDWVMCFVLFCWSGFDFLSSLKCRRLEWSVCFGGVFLEGGGEGREQWGHGGGEGWFRAGFRLDCILSLSLCSVSFLHFISVILSLCSSVPVFRRNVRRASCYSAVSPPRLERLLANLRDGEGFVVLPCLLPQYILSSNYVVLSTEHKPSLVLLALSFLS